MEHATRQGPRYGEFTWVECASTDPGRSQSFVTELFGWQASGGHERVVLSQSGRAVASLVPATERSAWRSWVAVEAVDSLVARVPELGGTCDPVVDVPGGRLATIRDPNGAVVQLWQPGHDASELGRGVRGARHCPCWNELYTRDAPAVRRFLSELLGWTFEAADMGDGFEYAMIDDARGARVGGVLSMDDKFEGVAPFWAVYFAVEDADAAAARAVELGGAVLVPPFDLPVGRQGAIADPTGAVFSVFERR